MSERHFKGQGQAVPTARGDSFDQIHSGLDHKSVKTSFTGHEAWNLVAGIVHWR
jgi:hypothetical protein